ncbi:hypothetical protein LR48_Vigan09g192700 [Vigna angularis]|uniref:Hydrophobic seed protein domain-containing protein n=1 Tax=Phaseolus angularis TaxID=3914 RepID=A0A0L9VE37_PHAAN|nr:hypothetical protein LR48_Vigan09g192700 [Vigna angularis]
MGSKSVAFLLSLNLLLFSALSCNTPKCVSSPPPVKCPKLHICANILVPPYKPDPNCCPLLGGLIDLEAVVCLCAVLKLDLGIIKNDCRAMAGRALVVASTALQSHCQWVSPYHTHEVSPFRALEHTGSLQD